MTEESSLGMPDAAAATEASAFGLFCVPILGFPIIPGRGLLAGGPPISGGGWSNLEQNIHSEWLLHFPIKGLVLYSLYNIQ